MTFAGNIVMAFTYTWYRGLLEQLIRHGYRISNFDNWTEANKTAILRHDVDFSLQKALDMALAESEVGVKSTFFLLLTSDFYNVMSLESQKMIEATLILGHEIGLHFDETRYPEDKGNWKGICDRILDEASVLSQSIGYSVTKVSMHRPTKGIIDTNLEIPGMINTYASKFFNDMKYVSDSRRIWREPVEQYIEEERYDKFQILIHPFWYNNTELSLEESIKLFVENGSFDRYNCLEENITGLDRILPRNRI